MKKRLFYYCFFIVIMVGIFWGSYYITKDYFTKNGGSYNIDDIPTQAVDANKEVIVSNITQFKVEYYDMDTKSRKEESITTPMEYLGLTREELIQAMRKYLSNPNAADRAKGMIAYELATFNEKEVVVRKTYSTSNLPTIYYIIVDNGYLNVYLENKTTLYDHTDIKLSTLPEQVQKEVINGKKFESIEDLYDFLQTYTS